MFKRLLQLLGPQPVDLPVGYHWHRDSLHECCVSCGQDLRGRWPDRWSTTVAWARPMESEPRAFGPVGICCAERFAPWPDEELLHAGIGLDCVACGEEMSSDGHGVDEATGLAWLDLICDGGPFPEEGTEGCGNRVRIRLKTSTAFLFERG